MGTLAYLFKYRERPNFLSRRWIKVWLKRIFTALDLVCLQFQRKLLIMSGMQIGQLSDLHRTVVQGAPGNIVIGSFSYVGKAFLMCHALILIGDSAIINDRATLLTASHDIDDKNFGQFSAPIRIGNYS